MLTWDQVFPTLLFLAVVAGVVVLQAAAWGRALLAREGGLRAAPRTGAPVRPSARWGGRVRAGLFWCGVLCVLEPIPAPPVRFLCRPEVAVVDVHLR